MVGIDIVKIERIKKFVDRFGEKALKRFLSENEIMGNGTNFKRLAGYWAVKEAISKSLKVGIGKDFSFFDVEILKDKRGAPIAKLSKNAIQKFSIKDISISDFTSPACGTITVNSSK